MPKTYPAKVRDRAFMLEEEGEGPSSISRTLKEEFHQEPTKSTVKNWLDNPEKYKPTSGELGEEAIADEEKEVEETTVPSSGWGTAAEVDVSMMAPKKVKLDPRTLILYDVVKSETEFDGNFSDFMNGCALACCRDLLDIEVT